MIRTSEEMARTIDHTLLKPEATPDQIDVLCEEAVEYGFKGVCVQPIHVCRVAGKLASCRTTGANQPCPVVISVAGFPLGGSATVTKVDEACRAMDEGAREIDMVIRLGALIANEHDAARRDIEAVAHAVHRTADGGILKVILETAALADEQIIIACRLCTEAGADFVKTSTGFHPAGGATVGHVCLLSRHASSMKVKASGGIRTAAAAQAMLDAGASRIGTSCGVAIMEELRQSAV